MLLFKILYSRIVQQEIDILYNLFENYLNIDEYIHHRIRKSRRDIIVS